MTGATGPTGAAGSNGANGSNGSGGGGGGVTGATGPTGAAGSNGANGSNGASGSNGSGGGGGGVTGATGATGGTGPTGPAGSNGSGGGAGGGGRESSSGKLVSKKSEEGGWSASINVTTGGLQQQADGAISYPIPLPERPKVVYLNEVQVLEPGTVVGCNGSANEPVAEPGYLCVYQGATASIGSLKPEWKNAKWFSLQDLAGNNDVEKEGEPSSLAEGGRTW